MTKKTGTIFSHSIPPFFKLSLYYRQQKKANILKHLSFSFLSFLLLFWCMQQQLSFTVATNLAIKVTKVHSKRSTKTLASLSSLSFINKRNIPRFSCRSHFTLFSGRSSLQARKGLLLYLSSGGSNSLHNHNNYKLGENKSHKNHNNNSNQKLNLNCLPYNSFSRFTRRISMSSSTKDKDSTETDSSRKSVSEFRKEYSEKGLLESEIPDSPFPLFDEWFNEAVSAQVIEPNAMCLSTIDASTNRPSARYVLLKNFDERGFVWYTNYSSRKGNELDSNHYAALTFWWGDLERSIRIEGIVEKVSEEESNSYYWSRPKGSQMGAWASNQSQIIPSREVLEKQLKDVEDRYMDVGNNEEIEKETEKQRGEKSKIPRPPHWGGFRLVPDRMEFWKGRQCRLHDRIVYKFVQEGWKRERLQP